jgi:hypothetical protein
MADLEVSAAVDTMMQASDEAGIRSAIGAAAPLSDPRVYYVRSNGNDSNDGSPNSPKLTAQSAYDAGVSGGQNFVLDLGVGSFSVTLAAAWSGLCKVVRGAGSGTSKADCITAFTIDAKPATAVNSNGSNGYSVDVVVSGLVLDIDASGGDVEVSDANSYTGGNGADVALRCGGDVILHSVYAGGGGDSGSTDGQVNAGNGANISLSGPFVAAASMSWGVQANGTFNGGSDGTAGTIAVDGSDLRGAFAPSLDPDGALILGRCAVPAGAITVFSDKGGNSSWE